jgi:hypothetical protein
MKLDSRLWMGVFVAGTLGYGVLVGSSFSANESLQLEGPAPWDSRESVGGAKLSGQLLQQASAKGPQRASMRSAYLQRGEQRIVSPASLGSQDSTDSELRVQLAIALRDQDLIALRQLATLAYGEDEVRDGLLIEANRLLGGIGGPADLARSGSLLVSFLAKEQGTVADDAKDPGALIHVTEAIGLIGFAGAQRSLAAVVGDGRLPRAARCAAALALASIGGASARAHLTALRNDLEAEFEVRRQGDHRDQDEAAFIIDSIREIEETLKGLG